jgi:hypothetical protein
MGDQAGQQLILIPHRIEQTLVLQRARDGYVNATAMCKAVGKKFNDYTRTGPTREFLAELASVTGIPVTELIQTLMGGDPRTQGSWVHPDVAINLAQWCSPKFAVAVAQWVREWAANRAKPKNLPYHVSRYMANRAAIPVTHFSMLNELLFALIAPLEVEGYTMPEKLVPDISEGKMFCRWLREEKGIDTDSLPTYRHEYGDGRVVNAKLYPNQLLAEFRRHFHEVWLPRRAKAYFADRDPKALQYLPAIQSLPPPTAANKKLVRR